MGRSGGRKVKAAPAVRPEKESMSRLNKSKGKVRIAAARSTLKTTASPRDIAPIFIVPRETDIACGRGKGVTRRPGNQNYHKILQESRELYLAATTTYQKSNSIELFRKRLAEETGRFITFNKMNQCFEISPKKAHQKIGQAIRYVIHGKEPRSETTGDKNQMGKKTTTTKKRGGSEDEQQQQQQQQQREGSGSSTSTDSFHSSDTSDASSVSASDDSGANETFHADFTLKDDEALMVDMQRGEFLEGIHFAPSQDENKPKQKQSNLSKYPSAMISLSATATDITSISDASVASEGCGTNVDVPKGGIKIMQQNIAVDPLHEQNGGLFVDAIRNTTVQDSEELLQQQQQQRNKGPNTAYSSDCKFGSSTAFGAGVSIVNEGIGANFGIENEGLSPFFHLGRSVAQDNFDMELESMPVPNLEDTHPFAGGVTNIEHVGRQHLLPWLVKNGHRLP